MEDDLNHLSAEELQAEIDRLKRELGDGSGPADSDNVSYPEDDDMDSIDASPAPAPAHAFTAAPAATPARARGAKGGRAAKTPAAASSSAAAGGDATAGGEDPNKLYCICKQPYDADAHMIGCDTCDDWFHLRCVGLTQAEANCIDKYVCSVCLKKKKGKTQSTLKSAAEMKEELMKEISYFDEALLRAEIERVEAELRASLGDDALAVVDTALIQKVRDTMLEHGFSYADVAAQSGIEGGQAALSSWLKSEPVGNLGAIQEALREWLENAQAGKVVKGGPPPAKTARKKKDPAPSTPVAASAHAKYRVGDKLDAQDYEGKWYPAIVREVKPGFVYVHYHMWSTMYDEWISTHAKRLAPLGSHSAKTVQNKSPKTLPKPKAQKHPAEEAPNVLHNLDHCVVCKQGGQLLCCDGCPAAYHGRCFDPPINPRALPSGTWYCPECEDKYKRVPVWIPGKTAVIRGERAPFKKDLMDWLDANPHYMVWEADVDE